MTLREKVIVSAYTGVLMCDFNEVHKYVEEKLGRPVWTHEFVFSEEQIKESVKPDFMALCGNGEAALAAASGVRDGAQPLQEG